MPLTKDLYRRMSAKDRR